MGQLGFRNKTVRDAEAKAKGNQTASVSDKIKVVTQMNQLGGIIISQQFQQYTQEERIAMLNQFAQLQSIANTFQS